MHYSHHFSGPRTRREVLVLLLSCLPLLAGIALPTIAGTQEPVRKGTPSVKVSVKVIVDYGDGVQKHFTALPWKSGMTALDAMKLSQQHPRGIRFTMRGKGARGFLTSIDGLKNDGKSRNWIYRLNGKLGDRSFAIQPLKAGDAILWKFGEYK